MNPKSQPPGVYTTETNAFPPSVGEVPTAIPAFVGYTEKAFYSGKDLHLKPALISSLQDFHIYFGAGPEPKFPVYAQNKKGSPPPPPSTTGFQQAGITYEVDWAAESRFYLYNSLRAFFLNGGGQCYIVSVGEFRRFDADSRAWQPGFVSKEDLLSGLESLKDLPFPKPTMLLIPDLMALENLSEIAEVQQKMLEQAGELKDRVAILDIPNGNLPPEKGVIDQFRNSIGEVGRSFGVAYYPWLNSTIMDAQEVTSYQVVPTGRTDENQVGLSDLFPANAQVAALLAAGKDMDTLYSFLQVPAGTGMDKFSRWRAGFSSVSGDSVANLSFQASVMVNMYQTIFDLGNGGRSGLNEALQIAESNIQQALKPIPASLADFMVDLAGFDDNLGGTPVVSIHLKAWGIAKKPINPFPEGTTADQKVAIAHGQYESFFSALYRGLTAVISAARSALVMLNQQFGQAQTDYKSVLDAVLARANIIAPSGAMAGIYTQNDNTLGVWNSPANVNVNSIVSPTVPINDAQQAPLNSDPVAGKSINAIRSFYGRGPAIVWGARTLDGNSQDYRYISVRRTLIMIEGSIKNACMSMVFSPNDQATWTAVKNMVSNFLDGIWQNGGLQGSTASQAYEVQIGLGSTMTSQDILNGIMRVSAKVAIVHPAEFIILTVEQEMASS